MALRIILIILCLLYFVYFLINVWAWYGSEEMGADTFPYKSTILFITHIAIYFVFEYYII